MTPGRLVVDADKREHQERRAAHEHQGELHGRILLAACAPLADEKIHRYERHLVEHEHREEVGSDEEAEHTGGKEEKPHEEVACVLNLPRGEGAGENDYRRKEEHGDGDTVDTHRQVDVQRPEPFPATGEEHLFGIAGLAQRDVVGHDPHAQGEKRYRADDGHGAHTLDAPAKGETTQHEQGYHHEIYQDVFKQHFCYDLLYFTVFL